MRPRGGQRAFESISAKAMNAANGMRQHFLKKKAIPFTDEHDKTHHAPLSGDCSPFLSNFGEKGTHFLSGFIRLARLSCPTDGIRIHDTAHWMQPLWADTTSP